MADEAYTTDLIAGQHTVIGTVTVESGAGEVSVTYTVTEPDWCLTRAHLYVGAKLPKKSAPGRFPYHATLDCVTEYTFTVPAPADCVYIAAHADAQQLLGYADPHIDAVAAALPSHATIVGTFPGGDSYWDTAISGTGTFLDGLYDGWCVDTSRGLRPGSEYAVEVYSSYDSALPPIVDRPENLDLINWIINQGYVGQASVSGGVFTYGDVQRSIWTLIDDVNSTAALGAWSQARVDEIISAATANGEGYVPGCGGSVAVILRPVTEVGDTVAQVTIAQVTFVELSIECPPIYGQETAWALGTRQFKRGWGFSFEYCCD